MELFFFTEERFYKDQNGKIYSRGGFESSLWDRYLSVFDKITVVARVGGSETPNEKYLTTRERINVVELPYFIGASQYLKVLLSLHKKIAETIRPGRSYICRCPGKIGSIAIKYLRRQKIPYGIEVVGDPWDVFAPGVFNHPLRPFLRIWGFFTLRSNVRNSAAALYVTRSTLQKRYPVKAGVFQTYASNVVLPSERISKRAKSFPVQTSAPIQILACGSLAQMYKAPDIALSALKILIKDKGCNIKFTWLGGGKYLQDMKKMASDLGISGFVNFRGNVARTEVDAELARANLFVHASRAEGLPRALVEAMGSGLPCIGSTVGGIPELLDAEMLVSPGGAVALAEKIENLIKNPKLANAQAAKNLSASKEFAETVLQQRREAFYNEVARLSSTQNL